MEKSNLASVSTNDRAVRNQRKSFPGRTCRRELLKLSSCRTQETWRSSVISLFRAVSNAVPFSISNVFERESQAGEGCFCFCARSELSSTGKADLRRALSKVTMKERCLNRRLKDALSKAPAEVGTDALRLHAQPRRKPGIVWAASDSR